jgi:hypothetical protein
MRMTTLIVVFLLTGCGPSYEDCAAQGKDYWYNLLGDSRCVEQGATP